MSTELETYFNNYNDAIKLWKTKVKRLKPDRSVESIPLINLKGMDEVADGANKKLPTKLKLKVIEQKKDK